MPIVFAGSPKDLPGGLGSSALIEAVRQELKVTALTESDLLQICLERKKAWGKEEYWIILDRLQGGTTVESNAFCFSADPLGLIGTLFASADTKRKLRNGVLTAARLAAREFVSWEVYQTLPSLPVQDGIGLTVPQGSHYQKLQAISRPTAQPRQPQVEPRFQRLTDKLLGLLAYDLSGLVNTMHGQWGPEAQDPDWCQALSFELFVMISAAYEQAQNLEAEITPDEFSVILGECLKSRVPDIPLLVGAMWNDPKFRTDAYAKSLKDYPPLQLGVPECTQFGNRVLSGMMHIRNVSDDVQSERLAQVALPSLQRLGTQNPGCWAGLTGVFEEALQDFYSNNMIPFASLSSRASSHE